MKLSLIFVVSALSLLTEVVLCELSFSKKILQKTSKDVNDAIAKLQATKEVLDGLVNQDDNTKTKKEVVNDAMPHEIMKPTEEEKKISQWIKEIRSEQMEKPSKGKGHRIEDFKAIMESKNLNAVQAQHLWKALIVGKYHEKETLNTWELVKPIEKYLESIIPHLSLAIGLGEKQIFSFLLNTMDLLSKEYKWTGELKRHILLKVSSSSLEMLRYYYKATHNISNKIVLKEENVAKVMTKYLQHHKMDINNVKIIAKSMVIALEKLKKDYDGIKKLKTDSVVWTNILSELALKGKLKSLL